MISALVKGMGKNDDDWKMARIEDDLISSVISLIDRAKGNETVMEVCLEILDEIYKQGILTNSAISKLMDGAE